MEPSFLFFFFFKIPLYLARTPRYRAFRSRNEPFFLRVTRIKKTSGRDNVVVLVVSHKSGRIAPLGMNRAAFLRLPIIRLCLKEKIRFAENDERIPSSGSIVTEAWVTGSFWEMRPFQPFVFKVLLFTLNPDFINRIDGTIRFWYALKDHRDRQIFLDFSM